jgi:hypothetical protein
MENALPLIHLQKEPMPNGWNPEKRRHQLCEMGQLLILSPWALDEMQSVNDVPATADYSRFHNMNTLAAQICALSSPVSAKIGGLGQSPDRPKTDSQPRDDREKKTKK